MHSNITSVHRPEIKFRRDRPPPAIRKMAGLPAPWPNLWKLYVCLGHHQTVFSVCGEVGKNVINNLWQFCFRREDQVHYCNAWLLRTRISLSTLNYINHYKKFTHLLVGMDHGKYCSNSILISVNIDHVICAPFSTFIFFVCKEILRTLTLYTWHHVY